MTIHQCVDFCIWYFYSLFAFHVWLRVNVVHLLPTLFRFSLARHLVCFWCVPSLIFQSAWDRFKTSWRNSYRPWTRRNECQRLSSLMSQREALPASGPSCTAKFSWKPRLLYSRWHDTLLQSSLLSSLCSLHKHPDVPWRSSVGRPSVLFWWRVPALLPCNVVDGWGENCKADDSPSLVIVVFSTDLLRVHCDPWHAQCVISSDLFLEDVSLLLSLSDRYTDYLWCVLWEDIFPVVVDIVWKISIISMCSLLKTRMHLPCLLLSALQWFIYLFEEKKQTYHV